VTLRVGPVPLTLDGGDDCASAVDLPPDPFGSLEGTFAGHTSTIDLQLPGAGLANPDGQCEEGGAGATPGPDVWYRVTLPPQANWFNAMATSTEGDLALAIVDGCGEPPLCLSRSWDGPYGDVFTYNPSAFSTVSYLVVDAAAALSGTFMLSWNLDAAGGGG